MKIPRSRLQIFAYFVFFALLSDIATGQDEKTAYLQGYTHGYADGWEKGGGGANNIRPGDTIVVAVPDRGGGSITSQEIDKFFMVFNGQNWTAFLKPEEENTASFENSFRYEVLSSEGKSKTIWNLDASESVRAQMKRLDRTTGKNVEDWMKLHDSLSGELHDSLSGELNDPGLKRYEMVKPYLGE